MRRYLVRLERVAKAIPGGRFRWAALLFAISLFGFWLWKVPGQQLEPASLDKTKGMLLISEAVVDLGTLPSGESRPVTFKLGNIGSRRLVVNQLAVGGCCGNTVQETVILPPGKVTSWITEVKAPLEKGSFEKTLRFTASDPACPHFELVVKGSVR